MRTCANPKCHKEVPAANTAQVALKHGHVTLYCLECYTEYRLKGGYAFERKKGFAINGRRTIFKKRGVYYNSPFNLKDRWKKIGARR